MFRHSRFSFTLILSSFFYCLSLFSSEAPFNGWAHIELGAGNYGPDGHTKASQEMTVLMKIENVSDEKNYIDDLEEVGQGDYNPEDQYGVLFWTLDELIRRYGEVGVFHVNDLYAEYALFATQKLIDYALSKGYNSVVIEAVPGDYQLIDSKKTLLPYGKTEYSTAHLKNPEVSFYYDTMDGDKFYASAESREKTRSMLTNLASLSETGLYLFILYHKNFIPPEEMTEYMEKGVLYQSTDDWDSVPYIFPEGYVINKNVGKVFHISK